MWPGEPFPLLLRVGQDEREERPSKGGREEGGSSWRLGRNTHRVAGAKRLFNLLAIRCECGLLSGPQSFQ